MGDPEIDERIHECIISKSDGDLWVAASRLLEARSKYIEEKEWQGPGHYLYWEWAGGWGEDYQRIYYCPICGVKLDA